MQKIDIHAELLKVEESDYGNKYKDHLLEQYKLYVESADKISDRRQKANDFFLAVNAALLTILGFLSKDGTSRNFIIALASAVGALMCFSWYRLIRSYKDMNSGKFRVIHAIEKHLPLALFDAEWSALGRGENPKLYRPFTHIEIVVPWIFILFYFMIFLWSIGVMSKIVEVFCENCQSCVNII